MSKKEQLDSLLNRPTTSKNTSDTQAENMEYQVQEIRSQNLTVEDPVILRKFIRFDDIESSFKRFNGKSDVHKWLRQFQEQSLIFGLSNLEKFVYAKKLMTEIARRWTKFESEATTFEELKIELINEFSRKQNTALTHSKLRERKKKPGESPLEYLYEMLEIASESNVETRAVITYTIEGLPGTSQSKSHMFEADNLKEFKRKLEAFETEHQISNENPKANKKETSKKDEKRKHCYNCGELHETSECPDKIKGTKCFKCNEFGHISRSCPVSDRAPARVGSLKCPIQEEESE